MLGITDYLWRLIPGNPILLRVVAMGSKRKRDLLIRCGYLGLLIFLVFILLVGIGNSDDLGQLAQQSGQIFYWMSHLQLALVALLAPIFTAGAITQERDNQTYDILLSTPLTNGQIVLGSLLSRLFFVVALLVSGIPIFSITQIFGGVAIKSIIQSFAIACATAFITGAIAMAIAVLKVGTRRTIFSFYLVIALYLAIPLAIESLGYCQFPGGGKSANSHISWFSGIHPFLALRTIFGQEEYMPPDPTAVAGYPWPIGWYLSNPYSFYVSFMFVLSFVLILPSVLLLRRLAQSTTSPRAWVLQKLHLASGDRTRKPRRVWTNPIAWREAKTKGSATRAVILRYGFMVAGVTAAIVLVVMYGLHQRATEYLSEGFDPAQQTVKVADATTVRTYFIVPETAVTVDGRDKASPAELTKYMQVSAKVADRGNRLASITAGTPPRLLPVDKAREFLLGLVIVEFAVILLMVTQSAASTVTREKEDGTLDLLLSTPITSRYYIWGKLRGLVSFVLPLVAVPLLSLLVFVVCDIFQPLFDPFSRSSSWAVFPESVFVLPGTIVIVTAFAAIIAMQMSLRCRRTVMAVMSSVGIIGLVCFGLGACGVAAANARELQPFGLGVSAFSPFTLTAVLINPVAFAAPSFDPQRASGLDMILARWVLFIFGWGATVGYGFIVWAMYRSMVKNFDMTIRKQAT